MTKSLVLRGRPRNISCILFSVKVRERGTERALGLMRLSIPVALPRRVPGDGNPPNAPRVSQWTLCCPLAHLLVVVANSLQLFLMVCFLFLLLWKLNDVGIYSWFWVFAPLWASDAITMFTSTFELRRCYNMQSIGHT